MTERSKHVFWQALIFTIVIFGIGLIFGFFLESYRADVIANDLASSEISLLDEQLRVRALSDFDVSCETAKNNLFDFADDVYWEARKLEEYDASSQLTNSFDVLHRRYDLLRTLIWFESVELKKKCGDDFHTLVYLYEYDVDDIDTNSRQVYMSRMLLDMKNKYPDQVLLIPIATNTDISTVDLVVESYDLERLPAIIVDENESLTNIVTFDYLENVVFEDDN